MGDDFNWQCDAGGDDTDDVTPAAATLATFRLQHQHWQCDAGVDDTGNDTGDMTPAATTLCSKR